MPDCRAGVTQLGRIQPCWHPSSRGGWAGNGAQALPGTTLGCQAPAGVPCIARRAPGGGLSRLTPPFSSFPQTIPSTSPRSPSSPATTRAAASGCRTPRSWWCRSSGRCWPPSAAGRGAGRSGAVLPARSPPEPPAAVQRAGGAVLHRRRWNRDGSCPRVRLEGSLPCSSLGSGPPP